MVTNYYGSGRAIANSATPQKKGTICCRLYHPANNKYYLLTCSHVMHAGCSHNAAGWLDAPQVTLPDGKWVWAMRTDGIDAALIEINPNIVFEYPNLTLAGRSPRKLTPDDVLTTEVFIVRRDEQDEPNIACGKIISICSEDPVNVVYEDGNKSVKGLIIITEVIHHFDEISYRAISSGGDSGAMVYDAGGNPIGMTIAGSDQFTYVLPFDTILSSTGMIIA